MKNSIMVVLLLFTLSPTVNAGPGHGHSHGHEPIAKDVANRMAVKKIDELIEKGVIPKSWQGIKASGVTRKAFKAGPEWVITFENGAIKEKSKQKLFVFFTEDGRYTATNYTGE
ncbi:MAG: DUF6488 family protein [Gammaproteobacteria bacterium]|nr:DUF6488 family protein [Gammaproteobacteria bacterium]